MLNSIELLTKYLIIYALGFVYEKFGSKVAPKAKLPGRARRKERLSRSKLIQAFLIDLDAKLFMYLIQCTRFGS